MHRDRDEEFWFRPWVGRRVPRRLIHGVASEDLVANAHGDAEITFQGEHAGYQNSLFAYLIGPHGELESPRLLWADASEEIRRHGGRHGVREGPLDPGDSIRLSDVYEPGEVAPGQKFGLLLLQNGYRRNSHRLLEDHDGYRLIDRNTHEDATVHTPPGRIALVREGAEGGRLHGKLFFTTDPRDDGGYRNSLNPDGKEHVISHAGADPDVVFLAFEDLDYGNRNFRDLFLRVDTDPDPLPPPVVSLGEEGLDPDRGVVIRGDPGDRAGYSVAFLGDLDGDGHGDLAIGAPRAGDGDAGALYLLFGPADGFPDAFDLSNPGDVDVRVLHGSADGDRLGTSVAAAGDVNGDGFADLIVGAPGAHGDGGNAGAAFLLFGGARPAGGQSIDGAALRIDGVTAGDETGISVAGGGDVNGDGFDDLLIGARLAEADSSRYSSGNSYLLLGGASGPVTDLGALDGDNGMRIEGASAFEQSGRSVAILGDINGDGFDDLAVGAPDADPAGRVNAGAVYVLFGGSDGFDPSRVGSSLTAPEGFVIEGESAGDFSGFAVAGAGDVNGDGFDDLVIGSYAKDGPAGSGAGAGYLVFGHGGAYPDRLDLGSLDGSDGFAMFGLSTASGTGRAVAGAGDVNGDGFDDFVIGARYADPGGRGGAGETYLIFGSDAARGAELDLSALEPGEGVRLQGTASSAYAGFSLGGPGDIDGDGYGDLLIGAPATATPALAGTTYLVFGDPKLGLGSTDGGMAVG